MSNLGTGNQIAAALGQAQIAPIRPIVGGASADVSVQPIGVPSSSGISAENMQPTFSRLRVQEESGAKLTIGEEQLYKAIERALKAMQGPQTSIQMQVHEGTNSVMIKVFNKETGDLIREIPPEKTLDLVVKMMEVAGILIDEKV
ncbi:flagellar protein FlaG [Cohnella massiliensis]|uniref:flagellar protein FlaG n=1 Tax=Cohnella massiliensis TaxID=1816691 RepID=UPI001FE4C9B9|nr:flagellar protein FlaG [Cohnella massiliensis]